VPVLLFLASEGQKGPRILN